MTDRRTALLVQEGDQPDAAMSPDQVAAHVQTRVRRIAEQAFWDSVAASLAEPQSTQGEEACLKPCCRMAAPLSSPGCMMYVVT